MRKRLIALAVTFLASGPAGASGKKDVMVPVRQFVDGFNKGDTQKAAAACADQTSIIDEVPPHEWHGDGACSKWMDDRKVAVRNRLYRAGRLPFALTPQGERA